jgi:hypothetical protein
MAALFMLFWGVTSHPVAEATAGVRHAPTGYVLKLKPLLRPFAL